MTMHSKEAAEMATEALAPLFGGSGHTAVRPVKAVDGAFAAVGYPTREQADEGRLCFAVIFGGPLPENFDVRGCINDAVRDIRATDARWIA